MLFFFSLISTRNTGRFLRPERFAQSRIVLFRVLIILYCTTSSADPQYRDSLTTGCVSLEFVDLGSGGGSEEDVLSERFDYNRTL